MSFLFISQDKHSSTYPPAPFLLHYPSFSCHCKSHRSTLVTLQHFADTTLRRVRGAQHCWAQSPLLVHSLLSGPLTDTWEVPPLQSSCVPPHLPLLLLPFLGLLLSVSLCLLPSSLLLPNQQCQNRIRHSCPVRSQESGHTVGVALFLLFMGTVHTRLLDSEKPCPAEMCNARHPELPKCTRPEREEERSLDELRTWVFKGEYTHFVFQCNLSNKDGLQMYTADWVLERYLNIKCKLFYQYWPDAVEFNSDSNTLGTEAGGSGVRGQPGLHGKTLSNLAKRPAY